MQRKGSAAHDTSKVPLVAGQSPRPYTGRRAHYTGAAQAGGAAGQAGGAA